MKTSSTLNLETTSLATTLTSPSPKPFGANERVSSVPSNSAETWSMDSYTDKDKFDPFSTSENTFERSITTSSLSSDTTTSSIGLSTTGASFTEVTDTAKFVLTEYSPSETDTVTLIVPK